MNPHGPGDVLQPLPDAVPRSKLQSQSVIGQMHVDGAVVGTAGIGELSVHSLMEDVVADMGEEGLFGLQIGYDC